MMARRIRIVNRTPRAAQSGSVLVELAAILPILIGLSLCTLEFASALPNIGLWSIRHASQPDIFPTKPRVRGMSRHVALRSMVLKAVLPAAALR